ncbi:uncharacterized protein LOC121356451 isoform X1 [Pyrgilauda ruficollis]|uniref:uncharacterized protein LOC121356451 isoform X1 n=1 Tax=Pyrgilauda ruficollis TaxID=221976 RepID=UPI001B8763DC|nr:uncharacterized protein LOC121356451 isoform X1 [Pyrgilauda ruficollis]
MNALTKEASCKPRPQRKRSNSRPPETDSLLRKSDGTKVLTGSSTELASKQTLLMGKFSCISHLLSEPGDFLEEQLPEISLADSLTDLSHSIESSRKSSSAVLSVSSRLREVPASKSLSTEGNRMPAKPPVWLKKSLIFKEETAEEIPGERNQVQSSSWSSPSQESGIRPLQDLNNARVLSHSSSEDASGRSSRRKRKPTCYKEPSINRLGFKLFIPKTVPMLQPLLCSHVLTLQGWTLCCSVPSSYPLCSVTLLFYYCVVMPKFCISTNGSLGFWQQATKDLILFVEMSTSLGSLHLWYSSANEAVAQG